MGLTAFGLVYLPLLLAVVLFARQWLPAVIIFASCIQAASVFNVPVGKGAFGISPYNVTALAAFCVLLLHLWQQRGQPPVHYSYPRRAFWLFAAYVVVAVIGALVLPWVFEGQPVNLLADPDGIAMNRLLPLTFSLSNVVQAANLCIHVVVLVYLLQAAQRPDWRPSGLILGLAAALALVAVLGVYEQLAHRFTWPSSISFWASNPGYQQAHWTEWGTIRRIAVPFSEPSYTSALLAAATIGFLAVTAFGQHFAWAFAGALLCAIGLFNSTGGTGWAAAGLALVMLLAWLTWRAWHTPQLRKRAAWLWVSSVLMGAAVYLTIPGIVQHFVKRITFNRVDPRRLGAEEHALTIVRETWGLGVGLGSNRPSGFMASLFSNTGIVGGALFLAMLGALLWAYVRQKRLTDIQLFTTVGLTTATLAMSLAIPDLNLPMFWAFIFLAFVYYPLRERRGQRTE